MFFDINDLIIGSRKIAHGSEWIVVKSLGKGFYLAAAADSPFPAVIKLICVEGEHDKHKGQPIQPAESPHSSTQSDTPGSSS